MSPRRNCNDDSEDKRKEREGKKFGKQVQLEKLKERGRGKMEMERYKWP
jgi:hypothetical protein